MGYKNLKFDSTSRKETVFLCLLKAELKAKNVILQRSRKSLRSFLMREGPWCCRANRSTASSEPTSPSRSRKARTFIVFFYLFLFSLSARYFCNFTSSCFPSWNSRRAADLLKRVLSLPSHFAAPSGVIWQSLCGEFVKEDEESAKWTVFLQERDKSNIIENWILIQFCSTYISRSSASITFKYARKLTSKFGFCSVRHGTWNHIVAFLYNLKNITYLFFVKGCSNIFHPFYLYAYFSNR